MANWAGVVLAAAVLAMAGLAIPAWAGDTASTPAAEEKTGDPVLDALLAQEKEARKACKIEICSILWGKKADGSDVSCHVIKTWPKADLDKMVQKAKVSWPWGHTHCQADIKLSRAELVAAMTAPDHVVDMASQDITCTIDRTDGDPYSFKIALSPKISFKDGKAVSAELRWGALEAPTVAKAVLWPATALDNQLNVLSGEMVDMVNQFVEKKCAEVKDELKLN